MNALSSFKKATLFDLTSSASLQTHSFIWLLYTLSSNIFIAHIKVNRAPMRLLSGSQQIPSNIGRNGLHRSFPFASWSSTTMMMFLLFMIVCAIYIANICLSCLDHNTPTAVASHSFAGNGKLTTLLMAQLHHHRCKFFIKNSKSYKQSALPPAIASPVASTSAASLLLNVYIKQQKIQCCWYCILLLLLPGCCFDDCLVAGDDGTTRRVVVAGE